MKKYSCILLIFIALVLLACDSTSTGDFKSETKYQPFIEIDGSSSIFPIAQEISNIYSQLHPEVKISLSLSGTSNGFMKLCQGRLDINNASREIKTEESSICASNGVELLELKIGYDAIVIAVHASNYWCASLTTEQLKKIWTKPVNGIELLWSDIDPSWPKAKIKYYSPGKLSGTQDVFLNTVFGENHKFAQEGETSEDHNDVVSGVSRDSMAIGYFAMPFLHSNTQFVHPVAIDDMNDYNGSGPVMPNVESIEQNHYHPFARPLYLYINKKALLNPAYCYYLRFYLENVRDYSKILGYAPLTESELAEQFTLLSAICPENQTGSNP